MADSAEVHALISGHVQGVGFRQWTQAHARRLGLAGSATNLNDGRVEVVAIGTRSACDALVELLSSEHTPGYVDEVRTAWSEPDDGVQPASAFRTG